jgi:hypothetical protein
MSRGPTRGPRPTFSGEPAGSAGPGVSGALVEVGENPPRLGGEYLIEPYDRAASQSRYMLAGDLDRLCHVNVYWWVRWPKIRGVAMPALPHSGLLVI